MTTTPSTPEPATEADGAARLAAHLGELAAQQDRAALAALRRGLGKPPGTVAEMHRHVVPVLGAGADAAAYLVAALFGLHPVSWVGPSNPRRSNFGVSLARLRAAVGVSGEAGIERRVIALLNADPDDLASHLRHAVALLRAHDIPVDWARLLRDARGWDHPDRWVQRNWAHAYWAAQPADVARGGQETDAAETDEA